VSFVENNPLRYTDPTGHADWTDDLGGCYACTPPEPPPPYIPWLPEPPQDPEPPKDPGPIIVIPEPGEIVIGPIVIPGTSPLSPETRICQQLRHMIFLTEIQLAALDLRIDALLDKLKNTRDPWDIQTIIAQVKRLQEERKKLVIMLNTLKKQAKAEGC
jgi:hypothetical protein